MLEVYAYEDIPETINKSVFLVGPTPRKDQPISWRSEMIKILRDQGFDGHIFIPEPRDGKFSSDYTAQTEWEKLFLDISDMILAWVPRDLDLMPAFTTNVEFGKYVGDGKLYYGRPDEAPKNTYLDWLYENATGRIPCKTMEDLALCTSRLKGTDRIGGQRYVPLDVYNSSMFQSWAHQLEKAGNVLEEAKVLWKFKVPQKDFLFSYILWTKIWISSEKRYKENEFIFSRPDTSVILPFFKERPEDNIFEINVVVIKEFRSPVRNNSGFVRELPGGSSFSGKNDIDLAVAELKEETGLEVDSSRIYRIKNRQLYSTLLTHNSFLYSVSLNKDEFEFLEKMSKEKVAFGVDEDTERTYVEIKTVYELLVDSEIDWATIGMIFEGLSYFV